MFIAYVNPGIYIIVVKTIVINTCPKPLIPRSKKTPSGGNNMAIKTV